MKFLWFIELFSFLTHAETNISQKYVVFTNFDKKCTHDFNVLLDLFWNLLFSRMDIRKTKFVSLSDLNTDNDNNDVCNFVKILIFILEKDTTSKCIYNFIIENFDYFKDYCICNLRRKFKSTKIITFNNEQDIWQNYLYYIDVMKGLIDKLSANNRLLNFYILFKNLVCFTEFKPQLLGDSDKLSILIFNIKNNTFEIFTNKTACKIINKNELISCNLLIYNGFGHEDKSIIAFHEICNFNNNFKTFISNFKLGIDTEILNEAKKYDLLKNLSILFVYTCDLSAVKPTDITENHLYRGYKLNTLFVSLYNNDMNTKLCPFRAEDVRFKNKNIINALFSYTGIKIEPVEIYSTYGQNKDQEIVESLNLAKINLELYIFSNFNFKKIISNPIISFNNFHFQLLEDLTIDFLRYPWILKMNEFHFKHYMSMDMRNKLSEVDFFVMIHIMIFKEIKIVLLDMGGSAVDCAIMVFSNLNIAYEQVKDIMRYNKGLVYSLYKQIINHCCMFDQDNNLLRILDKPIKPKNKMKEAVGIRNSFLHNKCIAGPAFEIFKIIYQNNIKSILKSFYIASGPYVAFRLFLKLNFDLNRFQCSDEATVLIHIPKIISVHEKLEFINDVSLILDKNEKNNKSISCLYFYLCLNDLIERVDTKDGFLDLFAAKTLKLLSSIYQIINSYKKTHKSKYGVHPVIMIKFVYVNSVYHEQNDLMLSIFDLNNPTIKNLTVLFEKANHKKFFSKTFFLHFGSKLFKVDFKNKNLTFKEIMSIDELKY